VLQPTDLLIPRHFFFKNLKCFPQKLTNQYKEQAKSEGLRRLEKKAASFQFIYSGKTYDAT
jgi:hypothetical protein